MVVELVHHKSSPAVTEEGRVAVPLPTGWNLVLIDAAKERKPTSLVTEGQDGKEPKKKHKEKETRMKIAQRKERARL